MKKIKIENNKNLLKIWISVGIKVLLAIASLTFLLVNFRDNDDILLSIILFAIVGGIFIVLFFWSRRRLKVALRQSNPKPLMEFFSKGASVKHPHADALAISGKAIAAALYGEPCLAETELKRLDWANRPPYIQAGHESAFALIEFARGSWLEGLRFAQSAMNLMDINSAFPGVKTGRLTAGVYVAIGRIFTRTWNASDKKILVDGFNKLPIISRLISAWGLLALAKQEGKEDMATQQFYKFINHTAPHCILLKKMPC